jgi:hypothetical protein
MPASRHGTVKIHTVPTLRTLLTLLAASVIAGCGREAPGGDGGDPTSEPARTTVEFQRVGKLESGRLDEASGIQSGPNGVFYLHNDEGERLFLVDATGRDLGSFKVKDANNRDWEDIARVPGPDGPLLVIGDIGDNHAARRQVSLYFLREPSANRAGGEVHVKHRVRFTYPDGPRDVEAMAYDPVGVRLLLLSKRDQPPRLYGLPLDLALWQHEMQAEFLGEVAGFRPPTRMDLLKNPGRGLWVSQPTGMDISPDGRLAAVLTYRSLYLFRREGTESWEEAFQRQPIEFIGPPGSYDEAVSFSLDGRAVYVTTERRPAPLYRLDLPQEQ